MWIKLVLIEVLTVVWIKVLIKLVLIEVLTVVWIEVLIKLVLIEVHLEIYVHFHFQLEICVHFHIVVVENGLIAFVSLNVEDNVVIPKCFGC